MANETNNTTPNPAGGSPCTPEAHQRTGGENQVSELLAVYGKSRKDSS